MYNLDLSLLSRSLITLALILQINSLRTSKKIFSPAFFIYSIGAYIMAYYYYKQDKQYSQRVLFKIFNSTLILLIALMSQ